MSFLIPCPNCGPREVYEFRYGGETPSAGLAEKRTNRPGRQVERWYHRHGCRCWLRVDRDVQTNEIHAVERLRGDGA